MGDVANIVELGTGANEGGLEGRPIDRAIAADFDPIADLDVAEMSDLSGRPVRIDGIAEPIAADRGVRMNFAIAAHLASRADEYMRVYDAAGAEARAILDDGVGSDHASIADDRLSTDDAIRSEEDALADRCVGVHDRGRVAFTPLREAIEAWCRNTSEAAPCPSQYSSPKSSRSVNFRER